MPALPLAGFVLNGILALSRPKAKTAVSIIGVGSVAAAFVAAAWIVWQFHDHATAEPLVFRYWSWLPVGDLQVDVALQLDQLSALMILIVMASGLIHLYSVGYCTGRGVRPLYFAYLNLFVFFMLTLVRAPTSP